MQTIMLYGRGMHREREKQKKGGGGGGDDDGRTLERIDLKAEQEQVGKK